MFDILYSLLIFPLESFMKALLEFIYANTNNYGFSIVLLSVSVNLFLVPIYYIAEKWKSRNKKLLAEMQPEIDAIKKCYKGKERYFYIQTIYRRFNFHPISSVKASAGLLIQIPFFIAAFCLLRDYSALKGVSFIGINDLSKPDRLLFGFNLLPFVMTIVNFGSAYLYSKNISKNEKIQIYSLALLFFIVLYSEPSALLVYWTTTNLFSFLKNLLVKAPSDSRSTEECAADSCVEQETLEVKTDEDEKKEFSDYMLRSISIKGIFISTFLLFVIPTLTIVSSSPLEFDSHVKIIGIMLYLFTAAFFLGSYISGKLKSLSKVIAFISLFVAINFLSNVYFFSGNYGLMDFFRFQTPGVLSITNGIIITDLFAIIIIFAITYFVVVKQIFSFKNVSYVLQVVILMILFSALTNSYEIFSRLQQYRKNYINDTQANSYKPKFHFSKNGKNVLILFFDRFMGGFVPDIFKDIPDLKSELSGFKWYPNTLSFGDNTALGLAVIYGGYNFTKVDEMQKSAFDYDIAHHHPNSKIMHDRFLNSTSFMVKKFLKHGYRSYVTDPNYIDPKFISDLGKNSYCENIMGIYRNKFLKERSKSFKYKKIEPLKLVTSYLIPFSLFKILPPSERSLLYNSGSWWDTSSQGLHTSDWIRSYLNSLSLAYAYPKISIVDDALKGSYMFTTNNMTHDPYAALDNGKFLSVIPHKATDKIIPHGATGLINDKLKDMNVIATESIKRFKDRVSAAHYFACKEALVRAAEWVKWMKRNNVYDNTMIIIVADHGAKGAWNPMFKYVKGAKATRYRRYHPVLLVKDFNASGDIKIDDTFMTNADVPSIALTAIEPDAKSKYGYDKSKGFRVYTKYRNLTVYKNIFNPKNWVFKN